MRGGCGQGGWSEIERERERILFHFPFASLGDLFVHAAFWDECVINRHGFLV
jgi:hypothetical protein